MFNRTGESCRVAENSLLRSTRKTGPGGWEDKCPLSCQAADCNPAYVGSKPTSVV